MYHTSCETGENYHQNLLVVTSGAWRRHQRHSILKKLLQWNASRPGRFVGNGV